MPGARHAFYTSSCCFDPPQRFELSLGSVHVHVHDYEDDYEYANE